MSQVIDESFQRERDFQQRFKNIESKCIIATSQLKENLLKEEEFKMSNVLIMEIYCEIYKLIEESKNFNRTSNPLKSQEIAVKVEEQLIELYKRFFNEFIEDKYKILSECQDEKEIVLGEIGKAFNDYKVYSYWLYKMFYYLDKFVLPARKTTFCNTSLKLFKDDYFEKSKQKILFTILSFVQEARQNHIQLNQKVKILIELFEVMGSNDAELNYHNPSRYYHYKCLKQKDSLAYYNKEFQNHLLQQIQNYYTAEINQNVNFTTSEFVDWGNSVFQLEQQMAKDFYPKSEKQIQALLNILFVSDQAEKLVKQETGVIFMLQSHQIEELKTLYNYIKLSKESIQFIAEAFKTYYEQQVHLIFDNQSFVGYENENQGIAYFQNLKILKVMEEAESILKNQFSNDPEIGKAFNVVFENFLGMNHQMSDFQE